MDNRSRSVSLESNWGYLKRESDWKFDKIQLKSLISIQNHSHPLLIERNVFKKNSGLKGIINIDFAKYPKSSAILLHNNTFEANSGLLETNVLSIRKQIDDFSGINNKKYLATEDLDCAGI